MSASGQIRGPEIPTPVCYASKLPIRLPMKYLVWANNCTEKEKQGWNSLIGSNQGGLKIVYLDKLTAFNAVFKQQQK